MNDELLRTIAYDQRGVQALYDRIQDALTGRSDQPSTDLPECLEQLKYFKRDDEAYPGEDILINHAAAARLLHWNFKSSRMTDEIIEHILTLDKQKEQVLHFSDHPSSDGVFLSMWVDDARGRHTAYWLAYEKSEDGVIEVLEMSHQGTELVMPTEIRLHELGFFG